MLFCTMNGFQVVIDVFSYLKMYRKKVLIFNILMLSPIGDRYVVIILDPSLGIDSV